MNLLASRRGRLTLFTVLYAAEGGPIGFIWWALPALLRHRGGAIERISTVMAVVTLLWVFKFLWAPLVDALRTERWGFRHWIISAQLLMGAALLPMLWLEPLADLPLLAALLVAHAVCATTQDVAIDGLAIHTVPRAELGAVNGFMQAGKYVGRAIFGGLALVVAETLGWPWIILGLVGSIWCTTLLLALVPTPAGRPAGESPVREFGRTLGAAFRRRTTWLALAFALTSGAAFEAAGALSSPLLVDAGLSLDRIGWWRAGPVLAALIAGTLLGGWLSDRIGHVRGTAWFLVSFVVLVVAVGVADRAGATAWLLALLTGMYLCFALFIASSYALFMQLTDPRVAATQFSTFMGATNGCESWATWAGGQVAARAGYGISFFVMSAVSLASLVLLRWLQKEARHG